MKRQVTLKFSSLDSLNAFQIEIHLMFFDISSKEKLLHCACTGAQIELAKTKYKAMVVDKLAIITSSLPKN